MHQSNEITPLVTSPSFFNTPAETKTTPLVPINAPLTDFQLMAAIDSELKKIDRAKLIGDFSKGGRYISTGATVVMVLVFWDQGPDMSYTTSMIMLGVLLATLLSMLLFKVLEDKAKINQEQATRSLRELRGMQTENQLSYTNVSLPSM